ncbi:MAG: gluconate 2-dehydrogenase subunit 3 family protein [Bacteroidota bacterium]|nr:gluconate 2-dehydrogenase subunit 3 family protein [Bacteroidota bacterium]
MDRRELLKMIASLTGGIVIGGEVFVSGCKNNDSTTAYSFSKDDIEFLNEVAETILPKTKTPGAKDAAVGEFMRVFVNDCYEPVNQQAFHEGITQLDQASKKMYDKGFMKITPGQRHDLLVTLDKEAIVYQKKKSDFDNEQNEKEKAEKAKRNYNYKKATTTSHYFTMMKQLTLLGFFSSKPGATEVLRYIAVPGRYDGSVPYTKGEKAWAT